MSVDAIAYTKTLDLGEDEDATTRLLLYVIGENTFNDSGRCLVGQAQLAYECGNASTKTISRRLKVLASRGLVRVLPRFKCSGGRAFDEIELLGFLEWYGEQHKARRSRRSIPDKLSDNPHGHSGQAVRFKPDSRSPVQTGQQESASNKIPVLEPRTHTQSACAREEDPVQKLVEALRSEGEQLHVVEHLLAPLVGVLEFRGHDPPRLLRAIRDACAGFDGATLAAAAVALRDTRSTWPSAAKAKEACEAAQKATPLKRLEPGEGLRWSAWMAHYRATGLGNWARYCEAQGYALVPSDYPPTNIGRTGCSGD